MNHTYKISMCGVLVSDPLSLIKAVFPSWDGQPYECGGAFVLVSFDAPQTTADLGPLVRVEPFDPNAPRLP